MEQNLEDINKEIESIHRVLSRTPDNDPNRRFLLMRLWGAHFKRYELLHNPDDIQKMIEYLTIALTLTPDDDPDLQDVLIPFAAAHIQRFQRLGDMDDIDKGIEYMGLALALTPEDHPYCPSQLANLAVAHKHRFEHLGELGDIEKAIQYDARAVAATPNDHPHLPERLEKLGTSYLHRFRDLGDLHDLEQAIVYQSRGLALVTDGDPYLADLVSNLATSHSNRFQRLGELDDLEKAVQYRTRVIALIPDGHPDLPMGLANLGLSHSQRFLRLGELDDLERAIQYKTRALALTPGGDPHLSMWLSNLGISHHHRFQRLGELDDLDKSIQYQSRALASAHDSYPLLPRWHSNLGACHSNRFQHLGKLDDIEKAIEHGSCAVNLTSDDQPHLPAYLANLGVAHSYRFQILGELVDLEKAIECASCALAVIADDHPHLCLHHFNHALSYINYYQITGNNFHLQDSLHSFRIACRSPVGAPRDRFRYAQKWATEASKYSTLNCIEGYQATIDLLPQFIWLGATTAQRYEDLQMTETLAVDAASAAILSSNYSLALEWLEQARCVVWNQNLMLRSPLDQLQASHPTLATQLQSVAERLHNASSESRESQAFLSSTTPEQVAQNHRRLAKEYNELLNHTRTLAGFEDFLQPIKAKRLADAARNGPIVIINCHKDRCDALLVLLHQDEVKHLPLSNFDGEKARRARSEMEMSIESQRLRERGVERRPLVEEGQENEFGGVLAVLWNDVVKPILDFLGFTNNVPVGNLPHITWCPTGAMTFLPLHAAGDYDQPRSRVFDYVISSYTPTLTALLESTPYTLSRDSRVLAIGQTATPGHSQLPGTAMELEYLKAHIHDKAEYSQLINNQAMTTAVLDAMEQHDWVHLACHAHQNVGNATESGFFLHDGVLDLASINRRSLKNKGLAFLSACQTATGDENLPDEAVHLASGMLMAGYTSVIATMWSVVDSDAPLVADKVYSELMKDGKLGNGEAGKALHNAVAVLRETVGEKEFGRWVPYIHIGS